MLLDLELRPGDSEGGVVRAELDQARADDQRRRKLGVTAVPLNYRLSDEEAAYVTDHSDATIVYVDAEFAPCSSASAASCRRWSASWCSTARCPTA
ncbi:MAG: hypothetical protein R2713_18525 [Ilumatobacteraceae bacterium]